MGADGKKWTVNEMTLSLSRENAAKWRKCMLMLG